MLLLLRPDWLRKNQTIWPHVMPWSLKECCLLKGQPCRKRSEILHESNSRAKKHTTEYLLYSRKGCVNSHCRGLDDPVGGWGSGKLTWGFLIYKRKDLVIVVLYGKIRHGHANGQLKRDCAVNLKSRTQRPMSPDYLAWGLVGKPEKHCQCLSIQVSIYGK